MKIQNKLQNLYYAIYRWFLWEFKYFPYTFYNGIKNLIIWFPIIWKNRYFDHYYLYKIEKHHLQLMLKTLKNNFPDESKYIINKLELAIKLLTIFLYEDGRYNDDYKLPYVNINNSYRFYDYYKSDIYKRNPELFYEDIRDGKALYLYNKIKTNYSELWWI